jgi:hypothetical protein
LVIDGYEDLERVYARWPDWRSDTKTFPIGLIAWDEIARHFDAVRVTEKGQGSNTLAPPPDLALSDPGSCSMVPAGVWLSLDTWSCESTFWLRWAFAETRRIGPRTFPRPAD